MQSDHLLHPSVATLKTVIIILQNYGWGWWWFVGDDDDDGWTIPTHVLTPTGVDSARHVLVSWHEVDEQFRIDDDDDKKEGDDDDD